MVRYLGPIPIVVGEGGQPLVEGERREADSSADRFWQRLSYSAAVVMAASAAFIALAAADDIAYFVQETYFIGLRTVGAVF